MNSVAETATHVAAEKQAAYVAKRAAWHAAPPVEIVEVPGWEFFPLARGRSNT